MTTQMTGFILYHPQGNGHTELINQVLGQHVHIYMNAHKTNWPELLLWAQFLHIIYVSESSGRLPSKLQYVYR